MDTIPKPEIRSSKFEIRNAGRNSNFEFQISGLSMNKLGFRCAFCLLAAVALANTGCLLVVGAAAGGAAGAAGYAYYKDRKDSDSAAVVVTKEPVGSNRSFVPRSAPCVLPSQEQRDF